MPQRLITILVEVRVKLKAFCIVTLIVLVTGALLVWAFSFSLVPSLERLTIPGYPHKYASLRELLKYYQQQLSVQGLNVTIRVLDETGFDEVRDVQGVAGNGYLFLFGVSNAFDTQFKCGVGRTITLAGVGTKAKKAVSQVTV
jgi:hypothetical protein